ncbi:MAG: TipAS antibiotic-recognition domain-containing protein [Chloroflexi bacterium]|nr:TipAS antibiotic-recognition domain-containing protein [Chloroflexota bacterium]
MPRWGAIDAALGAPLDGRIEAGHWNWLHGAEASAVVQMGLIGKGTVMEERYTPEQMKQFEALGKEVPPEEIHAVEEGWTALLAEVRAKRDLDPASEPARDLADRWQALTERTMRHYEKYPELAAAIAESYRQQRYTDTPRAPQPEDFAFIARVNEARGTSGAGGGAS